MIACLSKLYETSKPNTFTHIDWIAKLYWIWDYGSNCIAIVQGSDKFNCDARNPHIDHAIDSERRITTNTKASPSLTLTYRRTAGSVYASEGFSTPYTYPLLYCQCAKPALPCLVILSGIVSRKRSTADLILVMKMAAQPSTGPRRPEAFISHEIFATQDSEAECRYFWTLEAIVP